MIDSGVLPPMPPSDQDALDRNKYDGFYKVKARDFWGENEIHRIPDQKPVSCEHEFTTVSGGIMCTKCSFGLLGVGLSVKDGKALAQGKPISFPAT
jgi:hypothetical protein